MPRTIFLPPDSQPKSDGSVVGGWWHDVNDRIVCDLCPRACSLKPGDKGFCFVRENRDGELVLTTYGRSTGFCVDPIEKKPLNQFYPGTGVLSFGTAGCNLGCKFCQNWSISKSREVEKLSENATPEMIAQAALQLKCRSVAYTYNDPVIWAEYAIDVARACREVGVKNVAVTAGYITEQARGPFYEFMDAANVDLKAFTEDFYQHLTLSHIQPVLDTLVWLKRETDVWFEITNLVIPDANDTDDEFRRMCDWIMDSVGDDVPLHFTAFHPDFRLRDRPNTPIETLLRAYAIARQAGLKYVYVGNVNDLSHQSTYCPGCGRVVIERDWYELGQYGLDGNRCRNCGTTVAGHFDARPGNWGRKRLPVRISDFGQPAIVMISGRQKDSSTGATDMSQGQTSTLEFNSNDVVRPMLTDDQHAAAIRATSEIVYAAVRKRPVQLSDASLADAAAVPVFGCFVSIKRKGLLRGCCGFLGRRTSLLEALRESAAASATADMRLPDVSLTELPYLDFEIWLLYGQRQITSKGVERVDDVVIGTHGLQIQSDASRGLLLPGVATENGLSSEAFLRQVCMKAGLPPTAWREETNQLATFEGYQIDGKFDRSVIDSRDSAEKLLLTSDELRELTAFCQSNIVAIARGAVPSFYLPGCSDGSVHGLNLEVTLAGRPEPLRISQLTSRRKFPLQSSLFQACQTLGEYLAVETGQRLSLDQVQVRLAVQYDPAMHGTVHNPDLEGFDVGRRAILVTQSAKSAWVYNPAKDPLELVAEAAELAKVTNRERAVVSSYVTQASDAPMSVANVPQAQAGDAARPPAVAGMFYPRSADDLTKVVDELIPTDPVSTERWRAALVPHAGLNFSGKIAADVLRRIDYPELIIVLGPKHTAMGVEWAIAPHDKWILPGFEMKSDRQLAEELAGAIPRLELDALAHQGEHAIEVELPFIHKFAATSKVVGIAIGGGTLPQCLEFADGLAKVLRGRSERTLLVISSDMNHYASDQETRRVDEIAMKAIESLDPETVFHTVRDNDISMCGVLPAVIVMQTLKNLGTLNSVVRVAYGTSTDESNDASRAVGYAGMLFQ